MIPIPVSPAMLRLIGLGAAVAALTGLWGHGCHYGANRATAAAEAAHALVVAQAVAERDSAQRAYLAASGALEVAIAEARQIPAAPEPRTLIKEIVRHVPAGEDCRCPDFADDFRLRYNAASADRAP